jgi:hypothetical protein
MGAPHPYIKGLECMAFVPTLENKDPLHRVPVPPSPGPVPVRRDADLGDVLAAIEALTRKIRCMAARSL